MGCSEPRMPLRSLEGEDSPLRRRELARGLAYWSARYQRLPGRPGSRIGRAEQVAATAEAWPLVCEPESRAGFFFDIVRRLDRFPAFAEASEGIKRPDTSEVSEYLSALCRFAASAYLSHPERRVAYVHALTIPSAIRLVAPHVEPDVACQGAAGAFQAVAALHSMFGENKIIAEPDEEVARVANDWNEIRYHGACSLEEHAIKMVEACWREDLIAPDPIFRPRGGRRRAEDRCPRRTCGVLTMMTMRLLGARRASQDFSISAIRNQRFLE